MKPKKPKKKKSKKKSPPKQRSAIDVARNPQPYQFSLYTPPFPSVINHQPKANANSQNVANTFRNLQAVNTKELERLRGDLTAYRQESQTVFKKLVAFPKEKVYYDDETVSNLTDSEEEEEIEKAKERLIDEEETKITKGILEQEEQEGMEQEDIDVGADEPSVGVETLMAEAGRGAGTLSEIEQESATSSKRKRITKFKSKDTLRAEMEKLPEPDVLKLSNRQFKKTSLKQIREMAKERDIDVKIISQSI